MSLETNVRKVIDKTLKKVSPIINGEIVMFEDSFINGQIRMTTFVTRP